MRLRVLLGALAGAAVLSACGSDPTGFRCTIQAPQQTEVRGDTVVLSTGLKFLQLQAGAGSTADPCEGVSVHYDLFLTDGTAVESSRTAQPLAFIPGFGRYIPGFEQGAMGMKVGGVRRLVVPSELAYRDGRTLIFDIELLAVADR